MSRVIFELVNQYAILMRMKNVVSVVVPCHNEQRCLADCLQSLARQSVKALEVIVVDNNSTDNSVEIAKKFGAIVVNEKKQGIFYARNRGFNAAKGKIIARIDADSVADVDWIKSITETMRDRNLVAIGGISYTYELRWLLPLAIAVHAIFNRFHEKRLYGLTVLYGFNMAVRKNVWKNLEQQLDENCINEDIDFSMQVQKHGKVLRSSRMIVGNRLAGIMNPIKLIRYWKADGESAKRIKKELGS